MTPENVQVAVPQETRGSEPVEPEERTTALVRWEDRPQAWELNTVGRVRYIQMGGQPLTWQMDRLLENLERLEPL